MQTNIFVLALVLIVLGGAVWLFVSVMPNTPYSTDSSVITNFDECAAAGYPIMESYPRQCNTPDGGHFVEEISMGEDEGLGLQANGCAVAGCSGQLCVSADEASEVVSTCEYRAEYACYREASCEPQANGKCGWTQTEELRQCLSSLPELDATLQVM